MAKTFAEHRDAVQQRRVETADELTKHYGQKFSELAHRLKQVDDAVVTLLQNAIDQETEEGQEAALTLLRFLAEGFGARAGYHSGVAAVSYGISPLTAYGTLQSSHQLGLTEAVFSHRNGCHEKGCEAPLALEAFLHQLHHVNQVAHAAVHHMHETEESADPPLKN